MALQGSKLCDSGTSPSDHIAYDEGFLLVNALHAGVDGQYACECSVNGGVLVDSQQQCLFLFGKIAVDLNVAALGQITLM